MAAYTWPTSLPQCPLRSGFEDALAINTISTPMDNGPAKTRRRSAKQVPIPMMFYMTSAQVVTLEAFIRDDLLGVRRFNFTHPRTGAAIEVCIVPDGDGRHFNLVPAGYRTWHVGLSMVVKP